MNDENNRRVKGQLKFFDRHKGFGFCYILSGTEIGREAYLHRSKLRDRGQEILLMNKTPPFLSFILMEDSKGMVAMDVMVIEDVENV